MTGRGPPPRSREGRAGPVVFKRFEIFRPFIFHPTWVYDPAMKNRIAAALLIALAASPARADFAGCLSGLRGSAAAAGISAATFDAATRGLEPNMEVIGFLNDQPEFKTPIYDYLAVLVDEERVSDGKAKMREFSSALQMAESRFGVDRATIAAVWGVESDFGKGIGKRPIIQSLATLSCFGRRQAYFRTEFNSALKILQRGDVRADHFTGSWAGAFGHTQFMPSTFLTSAVDLDGDGKRDVIDSVPDALGSTANYVKKSGWITGQHWGYEVTVPADYSGPTGRGNKRPMSSYAGLGVRRVDGGALGDTNAGLLLPTGARGPGFLVTRNFDAIYAYNAAESYALAIALLSDRLRGGAGLQTPWPVADRGLSRVERREVQTLLKGKGYDIEKIDGVIGTKSRQAIADYQVKIGNARDGRPSASVLEALRKGR